ncbi:MAG: hypothetical protein GY821_12645 [Gammaproteobacteria bacterium]|nr:hypothetical protein [Gammaproteobacteria bacterium]
MARITAEELKRLINTTEDVGIQIDTANVLVTEKLGSDTTMSDNHLRLIELWLAAHFVATSVERQGIKEKVGATEIEFSGFGATGLGLDQTSYGQQVKVLDTTGILANLGKRKARVDVIEAIDTT